MTKKVTYKLVAKYFTGNCTGEEKLQVEKWRDENADNLEKFSQYRAIWKNACKPEGLFSPDVENALKKVNNTISVAPGSIKTKQTIPFVYYARRMAAAILIGAGIWLAYMLFFNKQEPKTLIAESGKIKKEILLSDGTHIWLNSNSMLRYPEKFKGNERKIYIEGEAYFDVAKNPKMPFIIETGHSIVKVLGTSFNLRARKNEILTTVTVVEGKVSFSGRDSNIENPLYLTAGEKGMFNSAKNELGVIRNLNPNAYAWKTGKLVFDNTPLSEVTNELSSYFNMKIVLEDTLKKDIPFTSTFTNQSIKDILSVLELSLSVKVDTSDLIIRLK